jgi:aspartyl-tRNA(Asn)/glutamyl-tRNA(Gln) amidotransferase subunit C
MNATNNTATTERMDVSYVARLARIELTPDEAVRLQAQMDEILVYIRKIRGLDLGGVEPTMRAQAMQNVFRPDTARPGLDRDAVLRNAPAVIGEQFLVPKIVE